MAICFLLPHLPHVITAYGSIYQYYIVCIADESTIRAATSLARFSIPVLRDSAQEFAIEYIDMNTSRTVH